MTNAAVDVITQNVSENIRREQARDLAASVVQAVFRLVKLSTLHSIDNQAMVRQVEETVTLVQDFGQRSGHNVSILFTHGSVFVCGQLLKANRSVYEGALELGEILMRCGFSELGIAKDIRASDFYAFVSALADALRSSKPTIAERPAPRLRLRAVDESVLRREVAIDRIDDETAAVVRAYATAIVIMRRFYEDLRHGRYTIRQGVKRITQRLVDLSANETPAFLGVTALRNQNHDEAGRAVNTAILSLAMTRQITGDVVLLQRLAMAALLFDTARPRLTGASTSGAGGLLPQLSEQQEADVPAGTAVVLTTLGLVNEPSVMRTVMAYEAHWMRRLSLLGPLYRGLRPPTLQGRILATARAFNDLLTPAPGETPLSADEAIAKLEQEATDAAERTVLRLLVGALGIFPTGTLVELSTGEVALVVRTPANPARYSQPRVRLVFDAAGGPIARGIELDLAERARNGVPARHIRRIVATSDDPSAAAMRVQAVGPDAAQAPVRSPGVAMPEPMPAIRSQPTLPAPPFVNNARQPPPQAHARGPSPAMPVMSSPTSRRSPLRASDPGRGLHASEVGWSASTQEAVPASGPNDLTPLGQNERVPTMRPGRNVSRAPPPVGPEPFAVADSYMPPAADLLTGSWSVQTEGEDGELAELIAESGHPQSLRSMDWEEEEQSPAYERVLPSELPPSAVPGSGLFLELPSGTPTAEGVLARTPLVHLLVYMLDRRLTGTTCFVDADGNRHGVFFNDGVPAKLWTGTNIAPLDRVILDLGLLDEATLRDTLREIMKRRVLHGRLLVSRGLLDRETVLAVLRQQLVRKLVALYELPPETRYAYFDSVNLLSSYGGPELLECEPLAVIMCGVRLHADDPMIDTTLDRISSRPLGLHIDAEMKRLQLHRDEASVVDLLRTRRMTLAELVGAGVAQERVVRLTIYALAITRHLDLGVPGRGPVGFGRERAPGAGSLDAIQVPARDAPGAAARATRLVSGPASPAPQTTRSSTFPGSTSEFPPSVRGQRVLQPQGASRGRGTTAPYGPPAVERVERVERAAAPAVDPSAGGRPQRAERGPVLDDRDDVIQTPPSRRTGMPIPEPAMPPRPIEAVVSPARGSWIPEPAALLDPRVPGGELGGIARPLDPTVPNSPRTLPSPGGRPAPGPQVPLTKTPLAGSESRPAKASGQADPPPSASVRPPPAPAPAPNPDGAARRAEIAARAATVDSEDYFEMLGISADAPPDRVQSAYFALAKQWHPDRIAAELQDLKPLVARVFARISEAYQTLSDPKRRADYLKARDEGSGATDDDEKIARVVDAALEFQKAEVLLKKNDLPGAELRVRRALAADPEQPEYLTLLAWIQAQRRGEPPALADGAASAHYDDLIQALDAVLSKEARYERALFYRGMLLKRSGRSDKAIRDFRLAAEINPKNLDAVREVRVHEMRNRPGNEPAPAGGGGILGKFFKR